jgi:hypothetical protein
MHDHHRKDYEENYEYDSRCQECVGHFVAPLVVRIRALRYSKLCVHPYEHHVGEQRHRGYGRFVLNHVEQYARSSGFKGVVAWVMDWVLGTFSTFSA